MSITICASQLLQSQVDASCSADLEGVCQFSLLLGSMCRHTLFNTPLMRLGFSDCASPVYGDSSFSVK